MQGPQSWGAPPPPLPQEMRENRKNQPEGWRSPLLRCPFQTPLSPFAQPLTKSLDPRPRGCAVNQLPGRLTGYHSVQGQPLPAGTREAREGWPPCKLSTLGPRGKEDTQVFPGASRRVHSQAWHPLPGPNHKQKQPSLQLTCRFSQEMGGLCDPESGMHTYNNTWRPETLRHTGTNHTQARCPHHSLTTRSIFSQAPDVSTGC